MKKIWMLGIAVVILSACQNDEMAAPENPPVVPQPSFRLLDSTQMTNDLRSLSSDAFGGRKAGTTEALLTYQLIQSRLRAAGVDSFAAGFTQTFSHLSIDRKNFIGLVKGTVNPDRYIVISAHHDHLGIASDGSIYHGADDNASGVAAVLAMAKYFQQHKPANSIIFALWDAEELGIRGSAYFVNNLPATMTLSNLKFNLNADMIARSDNGSIWASGLSHYPDYAYLVDSIKGRTTTALKSGYDKQTDPQDWTYLSDHASFHNKAIPFLYLGVEDHADYHKPTDTFEKVNLDKFTENANIFLQMALLLDRKL